VIIRVVLAIFAEVRQIAQYSNIVSLIRVMNFKIQYTFLGDILYCVMSIIRQSMDIVTDITREWEAVNTGLKFNQLSHLQGSFFGV